MTLVFRDEKGADLTAAEADGNIRHLRDAIDDVVENPPPPVSISNITESATQFTVWLSNGDSLGPFTKPVAVLHYRGEWLPETGYFENDLFSRGLEGLFFVTQDHESAAEFDPAEENSEGELYRQVIGPFTISSTVGTVSTTTYTPELGHVDHYLICDNVLGCEITVPNNSGVAVDSGSEYHFWQEADGPLVFVADSGVTLKFRDGFLAETAGMGSVVTLKKVATNTWHLFGGLAEESVSA